MILETIGSAIQGYPFCDLTYSSSSYVVCTDGYEGNLYLLLKLLLPGVVKSVYNINNKQLIKLYSQVRESRV